MIEDLTVENFTFKPVLFLSLMLLISFSFWAIAIILERLLITQWSSKAILFGPNFFFSLKSRFDSHLPHKSNASSTPIANPDQNSYPQLTFVRPSGRKASKQASMNQAPTLVLMISQYVHKKDVRPDSRPGGKKKTEGKRGNKTKPYLALFQDSTAAI